MPRNILPNIPRPNPLVMVLAGRRRASAA